MFDLLLYRDGACFISGDGVFSGYTVSVECIEHDLDVCYPDFYPESIIPARFLTIYKLNPLYHFIRFARTVIMDGVSPEPKAYLICFVFAVGSLIIGGLIFRKAQDKFVLYL